MTILLDTHVFLWWITDDDRLSRNAREIIANGANELLFSAASGWEIAIKARLGRIRLERPVEEDIPDQLSANGIGVLPVHLRHTLHVSKLPDHHRDPFDRLLIAQAQLDALPILTADRAIGEYSVQILW